MGLRYNIGAGDKPIKGWENLDMGDDITLKKQLSADIIYTSHFLEYFDKTEVFGLLTMWYCALKPDGILQISVPNFAKVVEIYQNEGIIMDGALYGKMGLEPIYHKSTFDKKTLREALLLAGFRNVKEFDPFHDDCSKDPISLNLQCRK